MVWILNGIWKQETQLLEIWTYEHLFAKKPIWNLDKNVFIRFFITIKINYFEIVPGMFDILVKYKEAIVNKEELKLPDEAVQSCISACYFGILWKQVSLFCLLVLLVKLDLVLMFILK